MVIAPSQPVVSSLSWLSGYSKQTKTNLTNGLAMLCLLCWLPGGSRMMIRSNHAYRINTRLTRVARLHRETNRQLLCHLTERAIMPPFHWTLRNNESCSVESQYCTICSVEPQYWTICSVEPHYWTIGSVESDHWIICRILQRNKFLHK